MSTTVKVKSYSNLDEAVKNEAFYAINTSDGNGKRPKGQLVMGVKVSGGGTLAVLLPATWIPIDLRNYVGPQDIVNSATIRDNMRNGTLVLVTKDTAESLRQHPAYAGEFARVKEKLSKFEQSQNEQEISINVGVSQAVRFDTSDDKGTIQPRATPITERILTANNDASLVEAYDMSLGGLTIGELRYIAANSTLGSMPNMIALELESSLMNGGLSIKSVAETQAYKDVMASGASNPVNLQF